MQYHQATQKRQRKLYLRQYLSELTALAGRDVLEDELGSVDEAVHMRELAKATLGERHEVAQIAFSEIFSNRFKKFIAKLTKANESAVLVWTPRTIFCGTFRVPSLEAVCFGFNFDINPEGIITFMTERMEDGMILDFSVDDQGGQILQIETQGAHWGQVSY